MVPRIGSALIRHVQRLFSKTELNRGMLIADGERLYSSLPMQRRIDPEVEAKRHRLEPIKVRLADYQKLGDAYAAYRPEDNLSLRASGTDGRHRLSCLDPDAPLAPATVTRDRSHDPRYH